MRAEFHTETRPDEIEDFIIPAAEDLDEIDRACARQRWVAAVLFWAVAAIIFAAGLAIGVVIGATIAG